MCCLASMEHPVRPLICEDIPPMLLVGPLIRLEKYSEANLGSVAGLEYHPAVPDLMSP